MLDDLVDRLEREPDYRSFLLDGQTVHLEDYFRVRPDQRARVAALVSAGRLQVGPWYVLADEQIPSGESLIRNLELGARDAAALGGRLPVYYSPDAFGHPAAGPLLAREFGLSAGALWRGLGREATGGLDLVWWLGPDGSRLLLYHLPPAGYEVGAALPAGGSQLARAWAGLRRVLTERAAGPHVAVLVGADHHAARPDLSALRRALAELEPESEIRISRLDEFLAAAGEDPPALATAEGELRWSYGYTWTLQGVHGTRARQKRRHSRLEQLLVRAAEPLAALAPDQGAETRDALLEHVWRLLVQSQFHDSIGGCCADPVAREVETRFDAVEAIGGELVRSCLHRLADHDPDRARESNRTEPALLVWNPAARRRGGVIIVETTWFRRDVLIGPPGDRRPREGAGWAPCSLVTSSGAELPVQLLHREPGLERVEASRHYPDLDEVERVRLAVRLPAMGGLGLLRASPGRAEMSPQGSVTADRDAVENGLVRVALSEEGIIDLTDRTTGLEWRDLLALESGGDAGDTYTFARPEGDNLVRSLGPTERTVVAAGPLVGAVRASWSMPAGGPVVRPGGVDLSLLVQLRDESPLVRCTVELDNRATDHRLRARLSLGLAGAPAGAGTAFGWVVRPAVAVDPDRWPLECPAATAPAHRWVAVEGEQGGLALFAPGFFEYEWTADGDLLFTILRAVGQLSRGDLPTRPGHAGWATATPEAQCLGPDRLQLAIAPLPPRQLSRPWEIERLWEDAFHPLRAEWIRDALPGGAPESPAIELEGDGLVFSSCRRAPGGDLELRCWNSAEHPVEGAWRLTRRFARAVRVRAGGEPLGAAELREGGRVVRIRAAPHELVTIRLG